jgi:hypothetical protein
MRVDIVPCGRRPVICSMDLSISRFLRSKRITFYNTPVEALCRLLFVLQYRKPRFVIAELETIGDIHMG